jgi:site-specific DNA recombinase
MTTASNKPVRCAIYTRVSTDQGLDQDFNSLDAQCEASQAYIRSQAHAGWTLLRGKYDDGGFSGGDTDRRPCSDSWKTCGPVESMSSLSIRSTASPAR